MKISNKNLTSKKFTRKNLTKHILFFLMLSCCAKEDPSGKVKVRVVETDTAPKPDLADKTNLTGAQLTARPIAWATVNQKVIGPRCVVCHSPGNPAGKGLDLSTHELFVSSAGSAYGLTFLTDSAESKMPKGAPLSPEEKQIMSDYMADGLLP